MGQKFKLTEQWMSTSCSAANIQEVIKQYYKSLPFTKKYQAIGKNSVSFIWCMNSKGVMRFHLKNKALKCILTGPSLKITVATVKFCPFLQHIVQTPSTNENNVMIEDFLLLG